MSSCQENATSTDSSGKVSLAPACDMQLDVVDGMDLSSYSLQPPYTSPAGCTLAIGDWGLAIADWGLGIDDWGLGIDDWGLTIGD
jgi:hypothetical protein